MGKSKLQTPEMQSNHAQDQDHAMELADKKYSDLRTPHHRDTTQPDRKDGNIHVQAYTNNGESQMERRRMVPGEKALYAKIRQPTIASWLEKTKVMTTLTQTREQRTIRPKTCKEMTIPKKKLQDRWENRHRAIIGKTLTQTETGKRKSGDREPTRKNQTHIMQLVDKYPEMPAEMDMGKERRKQLAELTPENPTGRSKKENGRITRNIRKYYTHARNANEDSPQ